jgi:NAD(P)-dependent dehydrogenase (short-subunit alcohol dehydrogenase family)
VKAGALIAGTAGALHWDTEEMAHESNLPDGVYFGEPPNLSFSDHVHRFVALNGVQCAIDRPEPETGRPPEDIAAMVAFLFSEDGAYINGQTILVDGGANLT